MPALFGTWQSHWSEAREKQSVRENALVQGILAQPHKTIATTTLASWLCFRNIVEPPIARSQSPDFAERCLYDELSPHAALPRGLRRGIE